MKKAFATLTLLLAATLGSMGAGNAGEPPTKNPVQEVVPTDTEPVIPRVEVGGFVSGILDAGTRGDAMGGGVNLEYFFTKNVGINTSYAVYAFENELHVISADVAVRYPIADTALAPYILVGGGLQTDGDTESVFRLGGGLDLRFSDLGNVAIFADGVYNWAEGDSDFTIARFGVRIPF